MSRTRLRAVVAGLETAQDTPGGESNPYETLVPDGEYEVAFRRAEKFRYRGGRQVWAIHMAIVSQGEHLGKPILFFLNAVPKGKKPTPGWRLVSTYEQATGLRPPKHLWRLHPKEFLEGCIFEASVKAGDRDSDGAERPKAARYSKVRFLRVRLMGTPPCIRRRAT